MASQPRTRRCSLRVGFEPTRERERTAKRLAARYVKVSRMWPSIIFTVALVLLAPLVGLLVLGVFARWWLAIAFSVFIAVYGWVLLAPGAGGPVGAYVGSWAALTGAGILVVAFRKRAGAKKRPIVR